MRLNMASIRSVIKKPPTTLAIAKATATDLVKVGLWHQDVGGWRINDWEEHQLLEETAKARSDHARKAAQARWENTNGHARA